MQNKKTSPPRRVWAFVFIMTILILVLVFMLIKQMKVSTKTTALPSVTDENLGDAQQGQNGTAPPNTLTTPKTADKQKSKDKMSNETTQDQGSSSTSNDNTSETTPSGSYARLGCFIETDIVCTIKDNDDIYSVLGQDPDTELMVNGVKIKPEKIIYQTSADTYTDEQMKDGQGKVLTSTNKEYDENTKTLTLSIGANPGYYNNLKPTEQRLLYLSQTVRSFLAMFGETTENFVQIESAVNALGTWQPIP
jgi:hypothetical protein